MFKTLLCFLKGKHHYKNILPYPEITIDDDQGIIAHINFLLCPNCYKIKTIFSPVTADDLEEDDWNEDEENDAYKVEREGIY